MIRYQENVPRKDNQGRPIFRGRSVPYDEQDATAAWAEHYHWQIVLTRIVSDRSRPTDERRSAEGELRVCERKLAWWQRHRNWDAADAARRAQQIKAALRPSPASSGTTAPASGRNAVG